MCCSPWAKASSSNSMARRLLPGEPTLRPTTWSPRMTLFTPSPNQPRTVFQSFPARNSLSRPLDLPLGQPVLTLVMDAIEELRGLEALVATVAGHRAVLDTYDPNDENLFVVRFTQHFM